MRKFSWMLTLSLLTIFGAVSQTRVKGVVKTSGTGVALQGVKVSLKQQGISTQTNANGIHSHLGDRETYSPLY